MSQVSFIYFEIIPILSVTILKNSKKILFCEVILSDFGYVNGYVLNVSSLKSDVLKSLLLQFIQGWVLFSGLLFDFRKNFSSLLLFELSV